MNPLSCLSDPFGCLLGSIPGWAWTLITLCAVLFAIGLALNLGRLAKTVAGWPGMAAAVGLVATIFVALWPKRRGAAEPLEQLRPGDPDAAPIETRRRPSKSILGGSLKDLFKPGGKR